MQVHVIEKMKLHREYEYLWRFALPLLERLSHIRNVGVRIPAATDISRLNSWLQHYCETLAIILSHGSSEMTIKKRMSRVSQ